MNRNNKKKLDESAASFSSPQSKKEREKSYAEEFITKMLGRVILTKKVFFGFDEQKIVIFVTPSLKIASIVSSPSKLINKFPLDKGDLMNGELIKRWSEDNGFEISFISQMPQLKILLYKTFGDVMVDNSVNESKEVDEHQIVLNEVKKSSLPESIKQWVIDNPEKFIKNIEEIKNLLK